MVLAQPLRDSADVHGMLDELRGDAVVALGTAGSGKRRALASVAAAAAAAAARSGGEELGRARPGERREAATFG